MPDNQLEAVYLAAVYEVRLPGRLALRFRVGDRLQSAPFALITAYNPGNGRPTDEANAAAHRRLETVIHAGGWNYAEGQGMSDDGSHVEPSLAVFGISRSDALQIAASFGQAAMVWFDGATAALAWTSEHIGSAGP